MPCSLSSERKARESLPISRRTPSRSIRFEMSSPSLGVSMPYRHDPTTGGLAMRMCTSRAPASRSSRTILLDVVPRTRESSTTTTLLPRITPRTGANLSFTARSRIACVGWMKLRPL
uniref:Uncharacterized protein n=1 Tax=Triticum urartu TaxID=4572 RepID=A0A8R7P3E4_TRIUA